MCVFGLGRDVDLTPPFPGPLFPGPLIPNPTISGREDVVIDAQLLLQRQSK